MHKEYLASRHTDGHTEDCADQVPCRQQKQAEDVWSEKRNEQRSNLTMSELDELIYFNLKGRAEIIRILYTYGGKAFNETRLEYGSEQWLAMKPHVTFGTLPMWKRGDVTLNQNIAIARLLAGEMGLVGDTPIERAQEDAIVDKLEEVGNKGADILIFEPDPKRKEVDGKRFMAETLPEALATLETALSQNKEQSGFFVGNRLKWCDIYFYCVADRFIPTVPDLLVPYQGLQALHDRVKATEGVAKWLELRPKEW